MEELRGTGPMPSARQAPAARAIPPPPLGPSGTSGQTGAAAGQHAGAALGAARSALIGKARGVVEEIRVDVRDLPGQTRFLTILGYAGILAVMVSALLIDAFGDRLPTTIYRYAGQTLATPVLEVWVAGLAFVIGWALLLTGATDFGWRLFVPTLLFFTWELLVLGAGDRGRPGVMAMLAGGIMLLVGSALVVQIGTRRRPHWRDYPLVEFVGWMVALGLFAAFAATAAPAEQAQTAIMGRVHVLAFVTLPLWLFLALEPARLGVDAGEWAANSLRARFSETILRRAAVLLIVVSTVPVVVIPALVTRGGPDWSAGSLIALVALAPFVSWPVVAFGWCAWRIARRRWSTPAAATGLTLTVAWWVLLATVVVITSTGHDLTTFALVSTGLLSPLVIYVVLLTHAVVTVGARLAASDGQTAPRPGRVLAFLGAAILILVAALSPAPRRIAGTGTEIGAGQMMVDSLFLLGTLGLCPWYLGRIAWRRWRQGADAGGPRLDGVPVQK